MREMYERGMSIPQIAEEIGVNRSAVRRQLLQEGTALRSRAEGIRLAAEQGRIGEWAKGPRPPRSPEWCAAISKAKLGKGFGTRINSSGYFEYTMGKNKGRHVHTVVVESILGRKINPDEVVHHVNHNRLDPRPANLKLMTRAEHTQLHRQEKQT